MKNFTVTSGKIIASDPCYTLDTWCQGIIENAKNGQWFAEVTTSDEGSWGVRIAELIIYHQDYMRINPNMVHTGMHKLPFVAGVDSGQFGFFDADSYRNDNNITDDIPLWDYTVETFGDKFYSACCRLTIDDENWGILPFGAVSSSGFGDGSYEIFGEKNRDGEYIALKVVFIEPDYDDDEDDIEDDEPEDDDYVEE